MAPETGQPDNLKQITAEQGRLEGLSKDKEASKEIKEKISSSEYRNVYITSLNEGKNSLTSAASSFKSQEAKDYLKDSASKLSTNVKSLADKGFELKQKTTTIELQPLDSLKTTLAGELSAEKSAIGEFKSIENLSTELEAIQKRDAAINKSSGFSNLTSNLNLKEALIKSNNTSWDKLIELKIKPDSVSNALYQSLYKKYSAFDDSLKEDTKYGAKFETASLAAKQQSAEVGLLETQIKAKPKPMSEKDYQDISSKLKEKAFAAYTSYSGSNMGAFKSDNSAFIDPLGKNFSPQYYEPLMLKLDNALLALDAKKPKNINIENDTELFNDTAIASAKSEFRAEAKLLSDLDKKIDEAYKVPKIEKPDDPESVKKAKAIANNPKVYDEIAALIKERSAAHADIISTHHLDKFALWKESPQKDLSIVVTIEYREPNKVKLDSLQAKQTAHEKEVKDFENQLLNDKLAEMLPDMDKKWQSEVNEQTLIFDKGARTVKQAPTADEKSQEFKNFQHAELNLLRFLVTSESQVNVLLSKKDVIDKAYLPRLEEYQKLCSTYLFQIGNNRTERNLNKASAALTEQTTTYTVSGAEHLVTRYRATGEGVKEKVEEYQKDPDRQESFKYKFSDYIEFVNSNDPKFKEINEGKGWRFRADKLAQLPEQVKILLAQQAANIISEDKNSGQKEVLKGKQSILAKQVSLEKAEKDLAPQGQAYFDGVKAAAKGNQSEAIKKFQEYLDLSKSFDQDTLEKHQPYIDQAKAQIETLGLCASFYEAVALRKTKPAEAIKAFSKFITDNQGKKPEEQAKITDQLNAAIEIVKEYNLSKYKTMEELRDDLLTLTIREIQEGGGTSKAPDKNAKGWRLELAEKGLNGPEVIKMNEFFKSIKTKIDAGEPVDFDAAFKTFAAQQQEYLRSVDPKRVSHPEDYAKDKDGNYPADYPNGHSLINSPSNRLITLFEKINKDGTKQKEAGYLEAAKLFYGKETGMVKTQKYLDKAMGSTYADYLQTSQGQELLKTKKTEMGNNPELAKATGEGAKEMYKQYVEEENKKEPKPSPPLDANNPSGPVFDSFKAQIFQSRFEAEVKRQIRKTLTDQNNPASKPPALELFNKSSPYDKDNAKWYKPWSWQDYDEDNWEDFKVKSAEFALETLVTLPIGMGAGAIGKLATRAALKVAVGEVLSETALTAFEQGGIRALLAEQSLSAVSRTHLLLAWGGGLAAEGTTMFALNSAWEGLSTGHVSWAEGKDAGFWKFAHHLSESIAKAGAFRAIGASQSKIISGMGAEAGGLQKAGAILLGEGFSGAAGTSLEAMTMMAKGEGDRVTMEFWMKSMAQNALMSYGTHLAHGATSLEHPATTKEKAKYNKVETEFNAERLTELGIKKPTDIVEVRALPGGEITVNGKPFDPQKFNFELMPKPIREALVTKITEARIVQSKAQIKSKLDSAGVVDPTDIVAVNNGKMVTKKGLGIPIADTEHLPDNFKPRIEELRREEAKRKVAELKPLESLLYQHQQYEKTLKDNPTDQSAKNELAKIDSQLEAKAKESGLTKEKLIEQIAVEGHLYKALDTLYTGEQSLYHESKVIKKPVLDENGVQRVGPDGKPLFEDVNLFKNYETKTSAYSTELLKSLDYAILVKEGGFKLIKIGGDEIVLYHAGEKGTVQKLFIDISNMGPTNDTAMNIAGSRVNLVDIYLSKISEHIKAQSESHQGKTLNPAEFMRGIDQISKELFSLDRGPNGEKIPAAEAEAKFNKLKTEWNLEKNYADYQKAVESLRIMAEYRADTRSLAASFKETKGVTFDQHITSQIEKIAGLPLADIQKLITDHREVFAASLEGRTPTSEKLIKKNAQGEIISAPPSINDLLDHIASLKPGSKAEDLMPLYNILARLDASKLSDPAFKTITDNLQKTRAEMIGEPPHPRVEEPRIMDAKIVSIDLPPEVNKALQQMGPVQAQAILTAARTLSEHSLDAMKYSKSSEFGKFNILDHIQIVEGKIVIKPEAKEFRDSYNENLKDKKVSDIVLIEKSLQDAMAQVEKIRGDYEQGNMPPDQFKIKIRQIEIEISKLEDRLSTDPDTGALRQAYLDLKPARLFSFEGNDVVLPQYRVMHSVITDLGQFGSLNSQYNSQGADVILKAYHDVLKASITKELPGDLVHFKIIRAGGKLEVIFLDLRSIEALAKKGLTPESLLQRIAAGPGKKVVDVEMAKNPEAKAKTETDAAVRNSLFKYGKGTEPKAPGEITVIIEKPITGIELATALASNPEASSRELIGLVMKERANNKAVESPIVKLTDLPPAPLTRNDIPRPISEVPRPTEILAIGDLHGNGEIFVADMQAIKIVGPGADFHNPESMHWTGGDRKIVFHGDIVGDRGIEGLDIMPCIRKLQGEARAAGGDISTLAGNHEDWTIGLITGKELPGGGSDAFNTCLYGGEQGKGILEFIQKFSGDSRFEKAKSLEEIAQIAGFKVEQVKGGKLILDKDFQPYLKELQQKILSNMRSNPEGHVILEQLASLKVAEYIDDTLFFHTDPSPAMVDLINKNGKTVGEGVDALNKKYQQGLRNLLLGEGTMPPDFQTISDAFTDADNRSGKFGYEKVKLASLKAKGVNRIIHGHSSDYNGKIVVKDGIEVTSVDFGAGKGGTKMKERSVALIAKDKGTLTTGVDVEPLIAPKQPSVKTTDADSTLPIAAE